MIECSTKEPGVKDTKQKHSDLSALAEQAALPLFLKKMKIPMRMAAVFILTALVPLCLVTAITYASSSRAIQMKTAGYLANVIELKALNAETIAGKYEDMMVSIAMSDRVQEDFRNLAQMDETSRIGARNGIEGYLFNSLNSTETVHTLFILPADKGKPLSAGIYNPIQSFSDTELYQAILSGNGSMIWAKENDMVKLYPQNSLTLALAIKNKYDGSIMGVLVMCLHDDQLLQMGKSLQQQSVDSYSSFILAQGNRLLWKSPNLGGEGLNADLIQKTISSANGEPVEAYLPGKGRILFSSRLTANGWYVADMVSYSDIMGESQRLAWVTLMLIAVFGGLSVWLAFGLSRSVAVPLHGILERMKQVEEGDLKTSLNENHADEFRLLSHGFNRMLLRIRELLQETEIAHKEARESELRALQAQINPHFLYNTLDSINWMANEIGADRIALMVTSLAKLFRLSLNKGKEETTLFNEFEHVRSYITIQQQRFQDKFDVVYQIDEAIYGCKTIKLILQPIVENSIYHGMELMEGRGTLSITGCLEDARIVLTVHDDGVGMSQETLDRLLSGDEIGSDGEKRANLSGYALMNVSQRLRLYYSGQSLLSVQSRLGEGTTVTIRFPFLRKGELT